MYCKPADRPDLRSFDIITGPKMCFGAIKNVGSFLENTR